VRVKPPSPQNGEENDEHEAEWEETGNQERTVRIPFFEGVKLGCALAIGLWIGLIIIVFVVTLFFGATLSSLLGN
jgi:hypothetical protein